LHPQCHRLIRARRCASIFVALPVLRLTPRTILEDAVRRKGSGGACSDAAGSALDAVLAAEAEEGEATRGRAGHCGRACAEGDLLALRVVFARFTREEGGGSRKSSPLGWQDVGHGAHREIG
jgi:hypothetical protein